ncbi:Immunoglobulin-like domain [Trinorchestia longiramus]|nr:Immunoglobulin-like domain [Trinorchestia longiramus]
MLLFPILFSASLLVSQFDVSEATTVEGIELEGGGAYAQLHSTASLHCRHSLDEGQTLEKLGWFRDAIPVLTWSPPDPPLASAEFRDRLDVDASVNGSLVFRDVGVNDDGPYTCTVKATDAQQDSSDTYYLVVADVPKSGFSMTGNVADCVLHFSFSGPPIYPKPTPLCGVWSTDTSYVNTATDWQAVPYYNGSVAYSIDGTTFQVKILPVVSLSPYLVVHSIDDTTFQVKMLPVVSVSPYLVVHSIDDTTFQVKMLPVVSVSPYLVVHSIDDTTFQVRGMPLQAGVRCEMSFLPTSGASDDDKIVAWTNTAYYPQVSERGCPPLEVGDGMVVHYSNHRATCRGELAPQDPAQQLVASIACAAGHRSSLRGGAMSTLQLQCVGGQQWDPVGGISWDEFEDMECTDNDYTPGETTYADGESEDLQEGSAEPEPEAEPANSAPTAPPALIPVVLLFFSAFLL